MSSYIDMSGGLDSCWMWTGAGSRYGSVWIGYRNELAHRAMAGLAFGWDAIKGMTVCHACDVPKCVNPLHLWLGTLAENNWDMRRKGRELQVRGEAHGQSKLTAADIRAIRNDPREQRFIAADYGVAQPTVSKIKLRQRWAQVD